jgi:hypothetical protein
MRIFSSEIDKILQDTYIPILIANGNTLKESKKIFKILLKSAKKESRLEGTSNLPKNYGSFLLNESLSKSKTRDMIRDLRKDGVRDDDVKWWWNKDDLERRIIEKIDDNIRIVSFLDNRKDEMSEEKAAERVGKYYPMYGDPKDKSQATGKDRPLPYELRKRVNIYIEKRSRSDPEEYKEEIEKSASFNALIRMEIRRGNV